MSNPKLIWTQPWQNNWLKAKAAFDGNVTTDPGYPWYNSLQHLATSGAGTDNFGLAATIMYQITGDSSWAQIAWNFFAPIIIPPAIGYSPCDSLPPSADSNSLHVQGAIYVLIYDWLKPFILQQPVMPNGMTAQQNFLNWLWWLCNMNLSTWQNLPANPNGPFCHGTHGNTYSSYSIYTGNINGMLGSYANLVFSQLALAADDTRFAGLLNAITGVPVGGLDPSATYDFNNPATWLTTVRNAIQHGWDESTSGVWAEGNQYEAASFHASCILVAGAKTALALLGDNTDHFPTHTQLLPNYGAYLITNLAPGERDLGQIGDTEFAHNIKIDARQCNAMLVSGLLQGQIMSSYLQKLINEWQVLSGGLSPDIRAFLLYNPYYPPHEWRSALPRQMRGLGATVLHTGVTGWDAATDSVYYGNTIPHTHCNHSEEDSVLGSFCLWRKGEWPFDSDRTYGGTGCDWKGRNAVGLYGWGIMFAHRALDAEEQGSDYVYRRSASYGAPYHDGSDGRPPYFNMPPEWQHELTFSELYVRSTDQSSDIRLGFIRTNAEDPTTLSMLPNWSHYIGYPGTKHPSDWQNILWASGEEGPYAPKQISCKIPTATPTIAGSNISWQTPNGNQAIIAVLAPNPFSYNIVDTNAVFNPASGVSPASPYAYGSGYVKQYLGYYMMIQLDKAGGTNPANQFDFFNLAWLTGDPGVALSASRVLSADGRLAGCRVHRGSQHEVLALASQVSSVVNNHAQPTQNDISRRIISTDFAVTWAATNTCTEVFLMDLDTSKAWTVKVDAHQPVSVPVSANQLCRFTVSGQRQHTILMTAQ
jgi:hypothetical protein